MGMQDFGFNSMAFNSAASAPFRVLLRQENPGLNQMRLCSTWGFHRGAADPVQGRFILLVREIHVHQLLRRPGNREIIPRPCRM